MSNKRIISKEEYPMVLDWNDYENTHTKLLCKCESCGIEIYKTIKDLDKQKSCYCKKCSISIKTKQTNLNKYGVENISQLEEIKNKKKNIKLEKYGDENYNNQEKCKLTKLEKYNDENYNNREKAKKTSIDKYGVENISQIEEVKKKKIKTTILHYKVEHFSKTKEFILKTKKTNLKKYGVEHYNNMEKIKQTNLERYGKEYGFNYDKIKNTFKNKYGVENIFQSKEIKDKLKQTNLEKYGVEYSSQINREPWQIEITSTKENFENYLKSFKEKPTVNDVALKLGFKNASSLYCYIKKFDLLNYFDSFSSIGEKELIQFIESLGFNPIKKKFNGKYEIDCFIPELNIGFEFNGNYWHSDLQKPKNYHYDKITFFQELGIRCIMIWEHEWINNNEYIKSYIKAQLGLCEKRIYARKCEVREITYNDCKELLNYHQQKQTTASNYIGLYYNNELVLAMLLQKPQTKLGIFKNKEMLYTWDVKREICKEGYSIVGGKSKVFKYFVNKYKPQQVVSYVDRSKFTGKSYEIMGFKLEKVCGTRYDWVINGNFKKRTPSIYKKMMELYNDRKALRIYDSGRYKFIWDKNL